MKVNLSKILTLTMVFLMQICFAQEKEITGTVSDDFTELIGATVLKKGTTQATVTDLNGDYKIMAKKGDVLVFSYVGYITVEKVVGSSNKMYIVLRSDSLLDEVVIVGYGVQKKENLTGAVTQISNDIVKDRSITRLTDGLQGAVGNLNITTDKGGGAPNSTKKINIRGYTGLGRTDGPLVVIDGIQGGDINSLNPSDVESITVVKDAAASAVYGSSAPNGVLIIKTKRGGEDEMTITYNSNFSFLTPIGVPKMLNSLEFAKIYNQARKNAGNNPFIDDKTMTRIREYINGTRKEETMADPNRDRWYDYEKGNANNDWFDVYLRDFSTSQKHSIGVSGGSEKIPFYIGLGYNERNGMYNFGKDLYTRLNLKANIAAEVLDWLEVGLRVSYSREDFDTPDVARGRTGGNWFHQIPRIHPNVPLFNPDGRYSEASGVPFHKFGGRAKEFWDKPTITTEAILNLAKGWKTTFNYTFDAVFKRQSSHLKTLYDKLPSGKLRKTPHTYPNGLSRRYTNSSNHIFNAFSEYEFDINESHNFKLLAGYVQEAYNYEYLGGRTANLFSDDIPSLSLAYGTSPALYDTARRYTTQGFFARFNYDYKDRYLLELVARRDGTSKYLKDVRWKTYPGVSVGWNVHNESFWNDSAYFNSLKLRASYGSLGDQSLSLYENDWNRRFYPFYPSLGTSRPTGTSWIFQGGREASVAPPRLVDNRLTWVTNTTLDFGLDATFFNERLTATFDWYKKKAVDYIGDSKALPAVLGTAPPSANSVAYTTKGFELGLKWRDNINDNLSYSVHAQLSDYEGTIDKYPNEKKLISQYFNTNRYEGAKMGEIWGFVTKGYYTEDIVKNKSHADQSGVRSNMSPGDIMYEDLNGDGKITFGKNTVDDPGDRKIIGNSTPRYNYSLSANIEWKYFDFSLFLHGVGKRDFAPSYGHNYFWGMTHSEWQSTLFEEHLDRWSPQNPNGYFPKAYTNLWKGYANRYNQTKYLQDASYLRIKNIQIGFTFPEQVYKNNSLSNLRIFTSIDNIATFSKLKRHSSLDPELSIEDSKIYPLQRTYSIGINASF